MTDTIDFADPFFTHDGYRRLLNTALSNGYTFVDYATVIAAAGEGRNDLQCVVRHDCDNDLIASRDLACIEAELGIRATYFLFLRSALYNPFSQPNRSLIDQIVARGHWLGLHFDEQAYPGADAAQVAEMVDAEREWMKREFGTEVTVMSFHQPSQRVLQNQLKINCLNTYDCADMSGIFYISDSNKNWKNQDPAELFRSRAHPRIQLLTHPEWWTPAPVSILENWQTMFRHQFELSQDQALERELSYTRPHRLRFEPTELPSGS